MYRTSIFLQIDLSSIAQTLDFMLVRTLTSLQKSGILKIPRKKFGKVSTRFIALIQGSYYFRFLAWIWTRKTNNLESPTSSCWRYCYDLYRLYIDFLWECIYELIQNSKFQPMVAQIDPIIMSSWFMICNINHLVPGHLIKDRVSY